MFELVAFWFYYLGSFVIYIHHRLNFTDYYCCISRHFMKVRRRSSIKAKIESLSVGFQMNVSYESELLYVRVRAHRIREIENRQSWKYQLSNVANQELHDRQ